MANPYPMQGQPMMQPPMQQPPMGMQGGPGRPPVVRRGTSRAVPVVVSAGLAIGVFCGLLFGLGVDNEAEAVASTETTTTTTAPKKPDGDVAAPFQPEAKKDVKVPTLAPQEVKEVKKDGTTVPLDPKDKVAAGSGSAAPETPAKPVQINGMLKVDIEPEAAAKVAKVTIDGKEIEGLTFELDMTEQVKAATKDLKPDAKKPEVKKEVKVVVKASGFRDFTSKVELLAERDTTLKATMQKKPSGGTYVPRPPPPGGQRRPPGGNKPKCPKPPCGLIDI